MAHIGLVPRQHMLSMQKHCAADHTLIYADAFKGRRERLLPLHTFFNIFAQQCIQLGLANVTNMHGNAVLLQAPVLGQNMLTAS